MALVLQGQEHKLGQQCHMSFSDSPNMNGVFGTFLVQLNHSSIHSYKQKTVWFSGE